MIESFFTILDYEVPKRLQQYVFGVVHGATKEEVHIKYPVHPNGYPLLINIYESIPKLHINNEVVHPTSRLNIAGQVYNANLNIEIDGKFGQIGFVLYPSTPYYLFHKSGLFFLNKWRPMEDCVSLFSNKLKQQLNESHDLLDRVAFMLNLLGKLIDDRLPAIEWIDTSLTRIFKTEGRVEQSELSEKSGISLRHFRRKFKEVIGVSPKYYCKVIQLNTIFELQKNSDSEKLHHLALDCGYYDQAHFINDFNRFIGASPNNFLNGEHSYVKSYLGLKRNNR